MSAGVRLDGKLAGKLAGLTRLADAINAETARQNAPSVETQIEAIVSGDVAELATLEELAWLAKMAERNGYSVPCPMGGGKWAGLSRFAFTIGLIVGEIGDDYGYSDRFCYDEPTVALAALIEWKSRSFEGEPLGWHRHPDSGRRRPGGDPSKEYVNF